MNFLQSSDPEIWQTILDEAQRQQDGLEMIASENYTSPAVMEAVGSVMTNKYAEGYPGRRYYGGCEVVDLMENIARDRAKALFGAEFANVQPSSGSQANQAVYLSAPGSGRQGSWIFAGTWGSPDAWHAPELVRQTLRLRALRRDC